MNQVSTALCIITKDKPDSVRDVLDISYEYYKEYGVDIYIYDSSESEDTKNAVEGFGDWGSEHLFYMSFPPDLPPSEKTQMAIDCYGFRKEYDYIWPIKNGVYVDEETLKRIIDIEKKEIEVIYLDHIVPRNENEDYIIINPDEFYFNRAIFSTSLDTLILRSDVFKGGDVFRFPYSEADYQWYFGLWEYIFTRMSEYYGCRVALISGAVIRHSKYRKSGFTTTEGLLSFIFVWKDCWIDANMDLPKYYDPYKKTAIKGANISWIFNNYARLIKIHKAGGLTMDNIEYVLKNWEMVCDIPKEIVIEIARGDYDDL